MKISISLDKWESFQTQWFQPNWFGVQRRGQALHNFFELQKMQSHADVLDKLWHTDGIAADELFFSLFEIH